MYVTREYIRNQIGTLFSFRWVRGGSEMVAWMMRPTGDWRIPAFLENLSTDCCICGASSWLSMIKNSRTSNALQQKYIDCWMFAFVLSNCMLALDLNCHRQLYLSNTWIANLPDRYREIDKRMKRWTDVGHSYRMLFEFV